MPWPAGPGSPGPPSPPPPRAPLPSIPWTTVAPPAGTGGGGAGVAPNPPPGRGGDPPARPPADWRQRWEALPVGASRLRHAAAAVVQHRDDREAVPGHGRVEFLDGGPGGAGRELAQCPDLRPEYPSDDHH